MIRKVALVQGLRESFPDDFQGLYDASEMGAEINGVSYDVKKEKITTTEKKEPIKVGESKPDPKPPLKPAPEKKTEEKPKQKPHPESRQGVINEILALCKQCGCKTVEDAQGLTGYKDIADELISLKDLNELKKELEVKSKVDTKTDKESRKIKEEDIE